MAAGMGSSAAGRFATIGVADPLLLPVVLLAVLPAVLSAGVSSGLADASELAALPA